MADNGGERGLSSEQLRLRRRRSVAIAIILALLAVLFYVMALMQGPSVMDRPL